MPRGSRGKWQPGVIVGGLGLRLVGDVGSTDNGMRYLLALVLLPFLTACDAPFLAAAPTPTVAATATPRATPMSPPAQTPAADVSVPLKQDADLLGAPDDGYPSEAQLKAGDLVTIMYRVGDWLAVRIPGGMRGWVRSERVDVPPDIAAALPPFPEAFPVISGEIVQEDVSDNTLFKGRVRNVGAKDAYDVWVEIETLDANGNRVDLARSSVETIDIPAGEERNFTVVTRADYAAFTPRVQWSDNPP